MMIRNLLYSLGFWVCLALPAITNGSAPEKNTPSAPKDVVSHWNEVALDAIRLNAIPAPQAARILAMMHVAMFDAVNAIDESYEPYLVEIEVPNGASQEIAATSAAHRVLTRSFPQQAWMIDEYIQPIYSSVEDEDARKDGIEAGRKAADAVLSWRAKDESQRKMRYTAQRTPGTWQPSPPDYTDTTLPQWASVRPFALESGSEFRPSPPPALNSRQYKLEYDQVKELGDRESKKRSPEQTEIAFFWEAGPGTATTPGQWNQVAQSVVGNQMLSTVDRARIYALLNIALADAGIAAWDAKFRYNFWRPVIAIRSAQADENPETIADAIWTPLLASPAMPEYVSAHSTFSAAGAEVLRQLFGDQVTFELAAEEGPSVKRKFNGFSEAAQEAGMSRIYGGQHFPSANLEGQKMGRQIGEQVVDNYLRPKGEGSSAASKLKDNYRRSQRR